MPGDLFKNKEMRLANLQLCLGSAAPPAIGGTDILLVSNIEFYHFMTLY